MYYLAISKSGRDGLIAMVGLIPVAIKAESNYNVIIKEYV